MVTNLKQVLINQMLIMQQNELILQQNSFSIKQNHEEDLRAKAMDSIVGEIITERRELCETTTALINRKG